MARIQAGREPGEGGSLNSLKKRAEVHPVEPLGILATTVGTAIALTTIALAVKADEPINVIWLSAVFSLPAGIVAARGHVGVTRWQLPTPGAFVFFLWLLGIMPTLFEWTDESVAQISFSSEAIVWSRVVAFIWFLFFALALGRAPGLEKMHSEDRPVQWFVFLVVLGIWAVSVAISAENGSLSHYASERTVWSAGSVDSSASLWYATLTPLVMPLATGIRMRQAQWLRWVGTLAIGIGAVGLFIMSERRLAVVSIYMCLAVVQTYRSSIRWRWIVLAVTAGWIMTGPMVMMYRGMRTEARSGAGPVQQAWQSMSSYATDERARVNAVRATSNNVWTRLGASTAIFMIMDHTLEFGPNWSLSPLSPVIQSIPSFMWPEKNEFASGMNMEDQVLAMPGVPTTDFGFSPIAEFVFQFGLWLAPLGGLLYGLACRLVNATCRRALAGGPASIAWLACVVSLSYFDAGTAAFSSLREPLVLAGVLGVVLALYNRASLGHGGGRSAVVMDGSKPCGGRRAIAASIARRDESPDVS